MTDIVERLNDSLSAGYSELRKEAAVEIMRLRAKITEMERQEPVAWMLNCQTLYGDTGWILSWTQSGAGLCNRLSGEENEKKLYALPGAQPAPSVPDGFSREDLEAVADGLDGYEKTVNVGNVTGEGDDHLESTTAYAARFIRTMLAAAPEAKP